MKIERKFFYGRNPGSTIKKQNKMKQVGWFCVALCKYEEEDS